MANRLVALRLRPRAVGPWLRRVWDEDDAALVLDPGIPERALDETLARLRPARLVAEDDHGREEIADLDGVAVTPGTALVVATSGSTGTPKGVVLSHDAVAASTAASLRRLGCAPGEAWLGCLPMHHVAGLQVQLRSWALGVEPEIHDRFTVAAVAASTAAHVSLVPTQLARLLDAGIDLSPWRTVLLGGAGAPPGLLARASEQGVAVVTSYGMSETCGGCVYDGIPLDDVEAQVRDDGRIRLRGPVCFDGYRRDAAATAAAHDAGGWFVTGDVGRLVDGRLEVLGRADDVVVSGGENVPLEAVARALRSHPEVRDAAAGAREDTEWGHVVIAAVVPRDRSRPPTLAQLRDHVRRGHPAAFAPRGIVLVEAIPRDGLGKAPRAVIDDLVGTREG